jgi:thiamine pyrophosphate-dependent acetolactate synthase large subunit-like protein
LITTGQRLVSALVELGVRHVFGIPGVHTLELLRDPPAELTLVVPRHEQGAGFMADGYARIRGQPGVCLLITGPGVTNALTPVAQAYHDSQPVLVVASESAVLPSGAGRGRLHELRDQRGLLSHVTASSESVTDPAELAGALARAWSTVGAPRRRPAAIGVPVDILAAECAPLDLDMTPAPEPRLDDDALDQAADMLARSEAPVLLLGGGAVDAGGPAAALAELLGAPVVLTGNAAGAVPASHPLSLGVSLPFSPVLQLIADADTVLLVGTELSPVDRIYSGARLRLPAQTIRIDVDADELTAGPAASIALHGDAATALSALAARLAARPASDRNASAADSRSATLVRRLKSELDWTEQSRAHLPWIAAIDAALPPERIVALDSTQLAYTALHALPAEHPRSWLAPFGLGTLGPALPMAIGARLGRPSVPAVVIIGDGGLMFTVAELATAAQLRMALAVVVWHSHGYAEIRDSFARASIEPVGCDLALGDLAQLADGLGCVGVTVRTPEELRQAVGASTARDRPTVIEVPAA